MLNPLLADLNFRRLINYGGQPPVRHWYHPPLACRGFCIACERGLLANGTPGATSQPSRDLCVRPSYLASVSHAVDTSDFEAVLGPLPSHAGGEEYLEAPIMLIFESPREELGETGARITGFGEAFAFRDIRKHVATRHYYWMAPSRIDWPDSRESFLRLPASVGGLPPTGTTHSFKPYGGYLAYLLNRYHFKNAYVTNFVKWGKANVRYDLKTSRDLAVIDTCTRLFLAKEIAEFRPVLIFAFGVDATMVCSRLGIGVETSYHPKARYGPRRVVDHNDPRILAALRRRGLRRGLCDSPLDAESGGRSGGFAPQGRGRNTMPVN